MKPRILTGLAALLFASNAFAGQLLVYDNLGGNGLINTVIGVSDQSTRFLAADDFVLSSDTSIHCIEWWGAYLFAAPEAPDQDDFEIAIYTDEGGLPGASPIVSLQAGDNVNRINTGVIVGPTTPVYRYSTEVEFDLAANERYWLSVVNDTNGQFFSWLGAEADGTFAISTDRNGVTWEVSNPAGLLDFRLYAVPEPSSFMPLVPILYLLELSRRR